MLICKISKLFIRTIVQLWIFASIAFFSKSVRPRNMKFCLQRVSIWVNIQKKFQVPRSHSIGEKCDANFKLSSHFSRKVCDRGTWNFVCKEYPYGLIYKKNFKFLGRTVSEKSAMLISSYHRIFLEKCGDRGTWNLVCKEYPYGLIYKKNFKFLGRTVSEKNAMLTCKISKLFIRTIVQLWIFARYHRIFLEKCATEEHEIWFAKSIHMG